MADFINYFIGADSTNDAFNSSYSYESCNTPFSFMGVLVRLKAQSGYLYEVKGVNPAVDFNGFETMPCTYYYHQTLKLVNQR